MSNFTNWIFLPWKRAEFNRQKSLDFKMARAIRENASVRKSEIMAVCKSAAVSLKKIGAQLGVLSAHEEELHYIKDEFGLKERIVQPVFSENEQAEVRKKNVMFIVLIAGFVLCETILYWLISPLVVPNAGNTLHWILALFFALGNMFAIGWGMERHFKHIHAKQRFRNKQITPEQFNSSLHKKWLGYFLIVFCFGFIVAAGMARILFLENSVDPAMMSEFEQNMIRHAQPAVSVLTMIFTLILGIYMAILKKEYMENSVKLSVMRAWKKCRKQIDKLLEKAAEIRTKHSEKIYQNLEKGVQLSLDLQSLYQCEYDDKEKDLYLEYIGERGSLTLEMPSYVKYEAIQGADSRLFKWGVMNDPGVKDQLDTMDKAYFDAIGLVEKRTEELDKDLSPKEVGSEKLQISEDTNDSIEDAEILESIESLQKETLNGKEVVDENLS